MRQNRQRQRVVPAPHSLRNQPGRHQIQPRAAISLGDRGAEIAQLADARKDVFGPPFILVHAFGQRMQLGPREAIHLVEQVLMLGGQREGGRVVGQRHGPSFPGRAGRAARRALLNLLHLYHRAGLPVNRSHTGRGNVSTRKNRHIIQIS